MWWNIHFFVKWLCHHLSRQFSLVCVYASLSNYCLFKQFKFFSISFVINYFFVSWSYPEISSCLWLPYGTWLTDRWDDHLLWEQNMQITSMIIESDFFWPSSQPFHIIYFEREIQSLDEKAYYGSKNEK